MIRGTGQAVNLAADGQTDTYELISSVVGDGTIRAPDCGHLDFGPHITQAWDEGLAIQVFVFHLHVAPDNDRCQKFDRQRNEVIFDNSSPDYLKGYLGETVTHRWRFKLDDGFQPSENFTHLHQLTNSGGEHSSPIMTLTPRFRRSNQLELTHTDSTRDRNVVATVPLEPFRGVWVEAYERMTYGHNGSYSIEIRNLGTGDVLLDYDNPDIDIWAIGIEFVRPTWGIYRSLKSQEFLRDEQVRFGGFCFAKGDDDCP